MEEGGTWWEWAWRGNCEVAREVEVEAQEMLLMRLQVEEEILLFRN
jgi:hypothetical protein